MQCTLQRICKILWSSYGAVILIIWSRNFVQVDDFGVSVTSLFRAAKSDQTSLKCRDLVCDVETPPLNDCNNLTLKLEVAHFSSSGTHFYMYRLREGLGMRKIFDHGIRIQKNPQNRVDIFWIFMDLMESCESKVQLRPHLPDKIAYEK